MYVRGNYPASQITDRAPFQTTDAMGNRKVSISQKARAFALLENGVSMERIVSVTGLSASTIHRIRQVAYERGYDPVTNPAYQDELFKAAPRSGRPKNSNDGATSQEASGSS